MRPEPLVDRLPRLVAMDGPLRGHVFHLDGRPWSLGRGSANRIAIDDPSLSRQHCMVECRDSVLWLRDLNSHNGTFVHGVPIHEHPLREGDEIKVGRSVFRFLTPDSSERGELPSVRFEASAIENPTLLLLRSQDSVYLNAGEALAAATRTGSAVKGYQALLQIASALHASGGAEPLADALLAALLESVPVNRGAILLFKPGEDEPFLACTRDRAAGRGAPVDANRPAVDRAFHEGLAVLSGGSFLAAPLVSRQKLLGVIYLDSGPESQLTSDHLQLTAAAGVLCGPALEHALEFRRIEEENRELREEIRIRHEMVGESWRMQEVYRVIARVAPTESTVLILGETGTGKELVARAIHRNSAREKGPFIAINCAALTESLLESELFGHERGAFTGAVAQKKGKLEIADRGTVFLDEIGELPLSVQTKLLRVLQEREFERVGGTRTIRVDLRILAATNRDLRAAAAKGTFRDDLYYRLNVVPIKLPALRERQEDIPLLASYFLARGGFGTRRVTGLSSRAMACLSAYAWPGNVRELQHAIESAVVLGVGDLILPEDLPEAVLDAAPADGSGDAATYHGALHQQKGELILAAIEQSGGRITEAAKLLGLHPNYLHRLIRNLGLRSRMKAAETVKAT